MLGVAEWGHVKNVFQLLHAALEVEVDEGSNGCTNLMTPQIAKRAGDV